MTEIPVTLGDLILACIKPGTTYGARTGPRLPVPPITRDSVGPKLEFSLDHMGGSNMIFLYEPNSDEMALYLDMGSCSKPGSVFTVRVQLTPEETEMRDAFVAHWTAVLSAETILTADQARAWAQWKWADMTPRQRALMYEFHGLG